MVNDLPGTISGTIATNNLVRFRSSIVVSSFGIFLKDESSCWMGLNVEVMDLRSV